METPDIIAQIFNRDKIPAAGVDEAKRTFEGHCHCSLIQFNITLPAAWLPLRSIICHCSAYRYTHGTFGNFQVILPPAVDLEWKNGSSKDKLAGYEWPEGNAERLFCPTCGSNVGHYDSEDGHWAVAWEYSTKSSGSWASTHTPSRQATEGWSTGCPRLQGTRLFT
jgi:hypothetical protein